MKAVRSTTERLYLTDAYLTRFQARVVERLTWQDRPAVVLDRTAFYPEGGGQPSDLGTLNGVPVQHVQTRPSDEAVIHVLARPLHADEVEGMIDWERRFDHMQQHTAQHILSQAFLQVCAAPTVSVHLGSQTSTVDLAITTLDPNHLHAAEQLANRVIEENRAVRVHFVDEATLARWKVRRPPKVRGPVRVVEVEDFDRVPCGGTHVRHTGEIGLIAILRAERYKGGWRVTFVAGRRARSDYQRRRALLREVGQRLSCGEEDLLARVDRLLADQETTRAALRRVEERLWRLEAAALWENAEEIAGFRLVVASVDSPGPQAMRQIVGFLREWGPVMALLGWRDESQGRLLFAAFPGAPVAMGDLLKEVIAPLGGRGGGRAEWAEGALPDPQGVEEALTRARERVYARLQ